jgi:hypothetical protein
MKKTKQNQTETAITKLIDQVEKFFSTAPSGSSTSRAATVISGLGVLGV